MCISERCRHVRHNGARGGAFGAARDHVGMEWRRPAPGEGRSAKYDSEISQQTDEQKMYHGARTDDAGTDDLTEPKIPPEPFEQGGTGGISVFMPARRGCARARPFPDGIPAPVRCVSRQTKGNKAEERLDFCIYRTAKQRFCQGFGDKRGKMLFQDAGQAYHSAGGNAALCAV